MKAIVFRATVRRVSEIEIVITPQPYIFDNEEPLITDGDGDFRVGFPDVVAAAEPATTKAVALAQAFGAILGRHGAVKVTVEVDACEHPDDARAPISGDDWVCGACGSFCDAPSGTGSRDALGMPTVATPAHGTQPIARPPMKEDA